METDAIKDQMRQEIVAESVQVLRRHGKSDAEIRAIILGGFHIDAAALDRILGTK